MVDVFRDPVYVPEIVKDVIRLKIPALWLQEGVCHDEAAGWAEADGIKVVMDHCMLKEHMAWVRSGGQRTARGEGASLRLDRPIRSA